MIVFIQRLEIVAQFDGFERIYSKQNTEAAGLTGCIKQLKLRYRDIASLPYIPMSAVVDAHALETYSSHG